MVLENLHLTFFEQELFSSPIDIPSFKLQATIVRVDEYSLGVPKLFKELALENGCEVVRSFKVAGNQKYELKCNEGHIFTASRHGIGKRNYWCPICSEALQRYSAETASAFMNSVSLEPLEDFHGSRDPWLCRCMICGAQVRKRLRSVQQTGTKIGCQSCSRKAKGKAQRTSKDVAIAELKTAGAEPLEDFELSNKPLKSECLTCKRTIYPTLTNIRSGFGACIYCSGNKVDEKDAIAEVKRWGLEPLEPYHGNENPWKCRCLVCGKITSPTWINIQRKRRQKFKSFGCPECSFNAMGRRYSEDPELAKQKFLNADLEMIGEYKTARIPINCKCLKCGANTKQTLNGVMNGKACKFCYHVGIKYAESAYLYLILHEKFQSIKVGISNHNANLNRLESHKKNGWTLYKSFDFETADEAEWFETMLLKWIRSERNLGVHLVRELMPQGGFSETVDGTEITIQEIELKLMELIEIGRTD